MITPSHTGPPPSSASMHTRPPSADPGGPSERDGGYNVRSVPVRIYLPDGPVIQELVPPLLDDGNIRLFLSAIHVLTTPFSCTGTPHTLSRYLTTHLPLLFPPQPPAPPPSRSNPNPRPPSVPQLAYALVQGIIAPHESEMAWLGACLAGADGWVNICVGLHNT